jgi:hypothetical protein
MQRKSEGVKAIFGLSIMQIFGKAGEMGAFWSAQA